MISMLRPVFAALVAAALSASPALADAAAEERALEAAQALVDRAHSAMVGSSGSARLSGVESAVRSGYAVADFERSLLSRETAARLSDAERAQFRDTLPRYLASLYVERFGLDMSGAPAIGDTSASRRDVLVTVQAPRANGRTLPVRWRMRDNGSGPKVIDALTGGVSFVLTTRSEFAAIVGASGGAGLIAHMREKISAAGG